MRKAFLVMVLPLLLTLSSLAGKNLADYPLKIQVIESHWNRHRYNGIETYDGWGRADVTENDAIHGFDFSYQSSQPFHRTIGEAHYLAKWKKESMRMELLVGEIGSPDKYLTFDLKTSLREDVYVHGHDGAVAVSQQEYKDKWAGRSEPQE